MVESVNSFRFPVAKRRWNRRVGRGVLGIHLASAAVSAIMAERPARGVILGKHGFSLRDEFHLPPLLLEPRDAPLQQLFAAAHWNRLEKLAIGHVGQTVLIPVNPHEALGARIVRSDFLIGDGPLPVVERTKPQAVAGPAERAPADSLQEPVVRPVADAGEVVALAAIAEQVPAPACGREAPAHSLFQVGERRAVRGIVDPGAQPRPGFDQGDLQPGLSQRIDGDTTARPAANHTNIEFLVSHSTFTLHRSFASPHRSTLIFMSRNSTRIGSPA